MSTHYETEPQPTASVVLHTTSGEIAVELFAKQTPLTCLNFLQHCLDGYYDNTLFHRLVPGFIVQGGDPTSTGHGGESIYDGGALAGDLDPWPMDQRRGANAGPHGIGFRDEFHSRLKFNRRGLLGMANEGRPDTNGSQFFFTLDKADELNNKNTVFGRVAGPTIYNLTKIGQSEVQPGTDRPLYPVKLTHVEIVTNPFTDMRRSEREYRSTGTGTPQQEQRHQDDKIKGNKRKKGVNKTLLSFGDDMEDDEETMATQTAGADIGEEERDNAGKKHKKPKTDKDDRRRKQSPRLDFPRQHAPTTASLPSRAGPKATSPKGGDSDASGPHSDRDAQRTLQSEKSPPKAMSALEKTNAEIAALKASMRRTVQVETEASTENKASALAKLVPSTAARGRKLSRKHGLSSNDQRTLSLLNAFTSKLGQGDHANGAGQTRSASVSTPSDAEPEATKEEKPGKPGSRSEGDEGDGEVCDLHFIVNCQSCRPWETKADNGDGNGGDGDDDGEGWLSHTLNCAADKLGKDLSYRKKAEEEMVVIDPRERAQAIREDSRAARNARGGRGGTGRSWDQARHTKMAQAASLSGRGAR